MADDTAAGSLSPLRAQAIARSLDGARARAEERVQRFLDAARELIIEKGGLDFTVQDVVERSTQSLRSFYQFFDGKQHLLLAVYEEAIRAAATELRAVTDDVDDPLEKLHRSVMTIYEWSENDPSAGTPSPHLTVRSMAAFVFDLMVDERESVVLATAPLHDHLVETMEGAAAAGAVRVDNVPAAAGFVLQTAMFNAFGTAPEGGAKARRKRAEALWSYLFDGLSGPG